MGLLLLAACSGEGARYASPVEQVQALRTVFFDFDQSMIDQRIDRQLQREYEVIVATKPLKLVISGYTDAAGNANYNLALSRKRANAVAERLIALGYPPDKIEIEAFGARRLLIPTKPGIREPQNRRVEIYLVFK